jgi:hypothetical protein
MNNNITWDFVAGFFDGEGWTHHVLPTPHSGCRGIHIGIHQKYPEVLFAIRDFLIKEGLRKVYIYHIRRKPPKNPIYKLQISNKADAKIFLENIQHMAIVKREGIRKALNFIKVMDMNRFTRRFTIKEEKMIRNKYLSGEMNTKSIAQVIGCGRTTIEDFLRRQGIMRTCKEARIFHLNQKLQQV